MIRCGQRSDGIYALVSSKTFPTWCKRSPRQRTMSRMTRHVPGSRVKGRSRIGTRRNIEKWTAPQILERQRTCPISPSLSAKIVNARIWTLLRALVCMLQVTLQGIGLCASALVVAFVIRSWVVRTHQLPYPPGPKQKPFIGSKCRLALHVGYHLMRSTRPARHASVTTVSEVPRMGSPVRSHSLLECDWQAHPRVK